MFPPNQRKTLHLSHQQPPPSPHPLDSLEVSLNDSSSQNKLPSQLQLPQTLLSQESLKHYMEDSQREVEMERRRLEQKEHARKQFATSLCNQTKRSQSGALLKHDHPRGNQETANQVLNPLSNFSKMPKKRGEDENAKKDRLEGLLEKIESYTKFILQQNLKHHQHQKSIIAQQLLTSNGAISPLLDGKQSVSKRRLKKIQKDDSRNGNSSSEEDQPTLTRLSSQPSILKGGKLRDYQMDGINWMISLYETGINGILADEMGLGKTVQTISLLAFLREFKQVEGYFLIIMPKSVVGNWMAEFKRWCPEIRVVNLIPKKEAREEILKNDLLPGKFDVCITTFEGVRLCINPLLKFNWEYIIIDEAHKIKNEDSQTSKRIRQFNSKYRLLLTGTPLQNNLHELWSLLNFLLPEIFSSADDFEEWFDLSKNQGMTDAEIEEKNNTIIKQLHKIMRPFMLRRIKRDVEKSLLPKIEMHINVGITELQKSIYRQLLKKSTIEKGSSTSHYKNILIQLRKVCNHPYLFQGIEQDDAPELGDHLIKVSGKMQFLDQLLKKAYEDKSQTLIFSGFTSMLDILEDFCRFREYKYCRLDGNTDLDDRQSQIDDFTSPNSDKFIFLISTRAGGLGLNLMTANTVVLYDSDWNPQMDLQAMDRAHRIGQKKQVRVYRLITKNTMEEKMVEKQTMKLKLDSLIIQKGRMAPKNTGLQKDDLKDMVNYGADAIFEIGSNIDEEDIEEMIRKGEEKAKNLNQQAEDIMKSKFDMLNFQMDSCNLYQFEDIDYMKEKRQEAEEILKKNVIAMLDAETAELSRRKNKKNLAENNLCPNIYGNGNVGVSNEAKKKRLGKVTDFRFFPDPDRLRELIELEMDSKFSGYVQGIETPIFTDEMRMEKELIEEQGFSNWDRKDYQKFIQAMELYATDDYINISKHMESTKTPQEVQKYSEVFFRNVDKLIDSDKIIQRIQRAQKNVNFNMRAPHVIRLKVRQYQNALDDMNFIFATHKSKFFTKESDVILLCLTDKLGFGNWTEIKRALRRENRCRFDKLLVSRTEEEIKKRVIYLVQTLEKEEDDNREKTNTSVMPVQIDFDSINFEEMEREINLLVNDHEQQATKTFIHIKTEKTQKALKTMEKQSDTNKQPSLYSMKDSKRGNEETVSKIIVESFENSIHNDENLSGEYDKMDVSEDLIPKQNQKTKGRNQRSKKQRSEQSLHSDIRLGNGCGSSVQDFNTISNACEEIENDQDILQRELDGLNGYDDLPDQPDSNPNQEQHDQQRASSNELMVTTVSTFNEAGKKQSKGEGQGKVIKQSNLADWGVCTSSSKKEEESRQVGQKRRREDRSQTKGTEVEEGTSLRKRR